MQSQDANNHTAAIIYPDPSHREHHYKRALLFVGLVLALLVIGAIIYQGVISGALGGGRAEERLRQQYATQQAEEISAALSSLNEKPPTEAEMKATIKQQAASSASLEKISASALTQDQVDASLAGLDQMNEQDYQQWKASNQK